ncbi:MAG: CapA family protein [Bryobacterales bacterium]|nr:CapA family protein [Bryobacterales bacterium]
MILLLLVASLLCAQPKPEITRVVLGGDVMLARHVRANAVRQKDAAFSFRKIADHFRTADLAFVNLESPFAATGPYFEERMVFRAHPSMTEGLLLAGIDVVSTANNHSRDAGPQGIAYTLEVLANSKIAATGTSDPPVILERRGVRFGFLAYTFDQRNGNHRDDDPRVAMTDPIRMAADVAALKKHADIVIVSMHAGWEYWTKPNAHQVKFARAAIDAGAAVVAGHHPHVAQPMERYRDGLIFYSLGNLVFDQAERPRVHQGLVADVLFEGKMLQRYEVRPVRIRNTVPELGTPLP